MQLLISTAILYLFMYTPVQYEWRNPRQMLYTCILNDNCFQEYQNAQAPFESITVNQNIIHKLNDNFKSLE